MKIEKGEHGYFNTENDYRFGKQITLDGQILVPLKTGHWEKRIYYICELPDGLRCEKGGRNFCENCEWARAYTRRFCSKCGCEEPTHNNFCPRCGAKMVGKDGKKNV